MAVENPHGSSLPGPLARLASPSAEMRLPGRRELRAPNLAVDKRMNGLPAVFDAFGLSDGQVLSFHHHYRNGDRVVGAVLREAQRRGLKGLTIAASSLFPCHAELVPLLLDGTVRHVVTDYMKGPLADAIAEGALEGYCVLQSHGGRARAIESGDLRIDVAFVGAPVAHVCGDTSGRGGRLACGPLGYPAVDAAYARATVVIADEICLEPLALVDIAGGQVDAVVHFPEPGSPDGISSGSTVPLDTDSARKIGLLSTEIIAAAGLLRQGMSLQSGAGGYSLGAVPIIGAELARRHMRGGFLSGGITGAHAHLLAEDIFGEIYDVQCFDRQAVASSCYHSAHHMMTAAQYASPLHDDAVVNRLDVMLLGAVQVDHAFNVNVTASADGRILGGPGGHPDTAQGAKLTIVTTTLTGGGAPKIVPAVSCRTTDGTDVDVVVTDIGYAVNPARTDLVGLLQNLTWPRRSVEEFSGLAAQAAPSVTVSRHRNPRIILEHRLGHRLDTL